MNTDENEIYEFLKRYRGAFVSVVEISRNVGPRRRFNEDRIWAKPTLRRMEAEGWLESNVFGEFKLKKRKENDTTFLQAIKEPGSSLGDTTIISLEDAGRADLPKQPLETQTETDLRETGLRETGLRETDLIRRR